MKGVKILIGMRTQVSMRNLRISKFGLGLGKSVFSIEKSWQYFFFPNIFASLGGGRDLTFVGQHQGAALQRLKKFL